MCLCRRSPTVVATVAIIIVYARRCDFRCLHNFSSALKYSGVCRERQLCVNMGEGLTGLGDVRRGSQLAFAQIGVSRYFPTLNLGRLAQLVRAPALQAGGRWFEPSIAHHIPRAQSLTLIANARASTCLGRATAFRSSRTTLSHCPQSNPSKCCPTSKRGFFVVFCAIPVRVCLPVRRLAMCHPYLRL